jgi:Peptidase A4 family
MSMRAKPGRLLAVAVVGLAVAAGAWAVPALGAAGGPGRAPAGPSPSAAASERAAATRALERVFRISGPLPFERAPGTRTRRVGAVTIALSGNWSGYVDDNSTGRTYSAVTATWTQPKITCVASEDELAGWWVGLDGYSDQTVEQDGTFAWCYADAAYYYSWWETYPDNAVVVGTSVAAGDRITASVTVTSQGYRLTVTDSTHKANTFTTVQQCPSGSQCYNASAEWIAETPSGPRGMWPWPPFGTWRPADIRATSAGKTGGINAFPDDQIYIVGDDGDTLANTGNLASTGSAFDVTWSYAY